MELDCVNRAESIKSFLLSPFGERQWSRKCRQRRKANRDSTVKWEFRYNGHFNRAAHMSFTLPSRSIYKYIFWMSFYASECYFCVAASRSFVYTSRIEFVDECDFLLCPATMVYFFSLQPLLRPGKYTSTNSSSHDRAGEKTRLESPLHSHDDEIGPLNKYISTH